MGQRDAAGYSRFVGIVSMGMRALLIAWVLWISACGHLSTLNKPVQIPVKDASVVVMGRTADSADGGLSFGYPGVSFSFVASGGQLGVQAQSSRGDSWLAVRVDGEHIRKVRVPAEWTTIDLVKLPHKLGGHRVEVIHLTESWQGTVTLRNFVLSDGRLLPPHSLSSRKILVLGDSITCGEAIDRVPGENKHSAWWNARESYGMLLADALAAQIQLVCWGGRGLIRTWDNRTDQANLADFYGYAVGDGEQAVRWEQSGYTPDLIISAIGTNDFSPGIPQQEAYVAAYVKLLQQLRRDHPAARIVLTEGPLLGGQEKSVLQTYIRDAIRQLDDADIFYVEARQYTGDQLDFHPTRAQHKAMAEELLPELRRIMGW